MPTTFREIRSVVIATILLSFLGCSDATDDLPRHAIKGVITLDGKPLPKGMIRFEPRPGNPLPVQVFGQIEAGEYTIGNGVGPTNGTYSVIISSLVPATIDLDDDQAKKVVVKPDPIPARYNRKTELIAELKQDGPTRFDFTLTTTPP